MAKRTYTIGMAGHIDHGKTTLTKALTNIDTDRLQEEKERNISIEPGYAPLELSEDMDVSIIDVPGHERFIRQMIAGVAGIDGVILVVAADEGVMPQTKEHLEILSFLDVHHALIAVTKTDRVEEELLELVEEDIRDEVKGTPFDGAPLTFVDGLSGRGVSNLKQNIQNMLEQVKGRDVKGAFRLPIDQVFSVHGQGTVVRGTVYEGKVKEGESLQLLPGFKSVKARQLQVHKKTVGEAVAGQRLAINLGGIHKQDIQRGDVLVSADHYVTTDTVDIVLNTVDELDFPLKQRGYIKLHLGTAEVYGQIVFFDRNVLTEGNDEILCQLRLSEQVVTKREDRFILRRPTPVETIGGGWILNPHGERYKFGQQTIDYLQQLRQGTPEEQLIESLQREKHSSQPQLIKASGLPEEEAESIIHELLDKGELLEVKPGWYTLRKLYDSFIEEVGQELDEFHEHFSFRLGKNKSEMIQERKDWLPPELTDYFMRLAEEDKKLVRNKQYFSLPQFTPHAPKGWEKRFEHLKMSLHNDGVKVKPLHEYAKEQGIADEWLEEWRYATVEKGEGIMMDDKHLWLIDALHDARELLRKETAESFTIQEAKSILGLSRKYIVPFLEWLDREEWTKREEEKRVWRHG